MIFYQFLNRIIFLKKNYIFFLWTQFLAWNGKLRSTVHVFFIIGMFNTNVPFHFFLRDGELQSGTLEW